MGLQGGGKGGAEWAHRVARLGSFGTSFAGDVGHIHTHKTNPAQCRSRMLPSLSLPRCCIWPPHVRQMKRALCPSIRESRYLTERYPLVRTRPRESTVLPTQVRPVIRCTV